MIKDKNILKGKNCFITGATGGLGTSISTELALSECNLFLTSTNKKKLEKLKKDLCKLNSNITIYSDVCDLRKLNDIKKIIYKYDLVKIDAEGSEAKIITSLKKKDHLKTDFIVEVSGRENAQKILNHCNKFRISVFSHKNNWKKVHNLNKMPLHHSEGLIVITKDKSYFDFLRAN